MADAHRPSVVRALTMGVAWFGVGSALAGVVAPLVIVTLGLVRPSSVAW